MNWINCCLGFNELNSFSIWMTTLNANANGLRFVLLSDESLNIFARTHTILLGLLPTISDVGSVDKDKVAHHNLNIKTK